MSYTRDPDARTRGTGAIAAIDHASPRHRLVQRARSRALADRDRELAMMSRNAQRPQSLGAINAVVIPGGGTGGARRPGLDRGAGVDVPVAPPLGPKPLPPRGYTPPAAPLPPKGVTTKAGRLEIIRTIAPTVIKPPAPQRGGRDYIETPAEFKEPPTGGPKLVEDPLNPPRANDPIIGTSGGGGGGGSAGGGGSGGGVPDFVLPDLPDLEEPPKVAGESNSTLWWLAAAGVASYFLFFKKGI